MHRNTKFLIVFAMSISILFFCSRISTYAQVASQENNAASQPSTPNELWSGIIIAVVSAILGFLASIVVEGIKKRSEPKKQLSYSKSIRGGIFGAIEKDVENKVSILYGGKPAKNMSYILFDVKNTGNQQVRNQEIRFEFTEGSEILDVFFEPQKIPAEMDFEEVKLSTLGKNEKKYKIGTMKPKEEIGFRFIVQGSEGKVETLNHYTKSEEDVSFTTKEVVKVADDMDKVKSFLGVCLAVFVFLPLLRNILASVLPKDSFSALGQISEFFDISISLISLTIFTFVILPNLGGFIEAVVNLMSSKKQPDIQADKVGLIAFNGSSVIVDKFTMSAENNTSQGS